MADFKIAFEKTNGSEGRSKVSMHPKDSGNYTGGQIGLGQLIGSKFGVSAPVLSSYLRRTATVEDMKNLSPETAMIIAKKDYWNLIHGDEIVSQEKADMIYDDAYNSGPSTAVNKVQKALNITVTGKMDIFTLNKLNNK